VKALFDIFIIYGLESWKSNPKVCSSLDKTILRWTQSADEISLTDGWLKLAKYKLAAFFHRHSGAENKAVPPPPGLRSDKAATLVAGRANTWLRNRLSRSSYSERLSLLSSIQNSKKGMPRPPRQLVEAAVIKTANALTSDRKMNKATTFLTHHKWSEMEDHPTLYREDKNGDTMIETRLDITTVKEQLRRTVREIFHGFEFKERDMHYPSFPSTSATYTNSRSAGGQVKPILDLVNDLPSYQQILSSWDVQRFLWNVRDNPELMDDEDMYDVYGTKRARTRESRFESKYGPRLPAGSGIVEPYPTLHPLKAKSDWHGVYVKMSTQSPMRESGSSRFGLRHRLPLERTAMVRGEPKTIHGFAFDRDLIDPRDVFEVTTQDGLSTFEWRGKETIYAKDTHSVDASLLQHMYTRLYDRALELAMTEPPLVKPVGLAEALKVRVITKGPPLTGFVLKPLQRFLWRILKSHRVFQLIGKPVDEWIIQDVLGAKLGEDEIYLSGDYSAATDNLAPWVSECIVDELTQVCALPEMISVLFKRALTEHLFEDPENRHQPLRQTWGQLMGSVVSFPVLCIANAAFCRWSLELATERKCPLRTAPLLINGDDCLFRIPRDGQRIWEEICSFGGLEPSVGKFYCSRNFVQINSTNYIRREEPLDVKYDCAAGTRAQYFSLVKYVNLGLLYGFKRSGGLASAFEQSAEDGVGSRCRDLVNSSPDSLKEIVLRFFLKHHRDTLSQVRVPYYVSESYGGLGLPPLRNLDGEWIDGLCPSELDRRILMRILEDPKKYPVGKTPLATPWKLHQLVMKRLPRHEIFNPSEKEIENYQRLYALLTVETLFRNEFHEIYSESESRHGCLRRNERTWKRAEWSENLPPPCSVERTQLVRPDELFLRVDLIDPVLI
jgi:hypothetical protein